MIYIINWIYSYEQYFICCFEHLYFVFKCLFIFFICFSTGLFLIEWKISIFFFYNVKDLKNYV